ncbi:MAG: 3-isopropylmalate dehydratase small subunit [Deltaproteobacteria bacterium]|nr:3-isopropylmalate dehydratase small subunit [Deltaproteobacteria bacterium]
MSEREKFGEVLSHAVPLAVDNIDTDQIIPARFLRVTHKDGLAEVVFSDWRKDPDFVLNRPTSAGAKILVAGDNFGCGSSREHAPWALVAWGFRVVVSTRFADIFRNNALKNGLLPVQVEAKVVQKMLAAIADDPTTVFEVDLQRQVLVMPTGEPVRFPIDAFSKKCLLEGVDELGYLLGHEAAIAAFEARRGEAQPAGASG